MSKEKNERVLYLEGIRGIAALIVFIHHLLLAFWPTIYFGTIGTSHGCFDSLIYNWAAVFGFIHSGTFSVAVFFVLSGYVMTFRYKFSEDLVIVQASTMKRYVRLLVPSAVSIFIAWGLLATNLMYNQRAATLTKSIWLSWFYGFQSNFFMASKEALYGSLLLGHAQYNSSLWSLSIEFYGSIMAMAIAVLFAQVKKMSFLLALIFSTLILYHFGIAGVWYIPIIFGWALTSIDRNSDWSIFLSLPIFFVALFLAGANDSPVYNNIHSNNFNFGGKEIERNSIFYCIGSVLLLLSVLKCRHLKNFFKLKPFVFLGKISFSLYVIHVPIILSVGCYAILFLEKFFNYNLAASIASLLCLIFIFALSIIYEKYIDKCSIRFANFLNDRIVSLNSIKKEQ